MRADVVTLDAIKLDSESNAVLIKASQPVTGPDDAEPYGDLPLMQSLGLTCAPWPADESGYAEGVVLENVGGNDACIIGARDTRTAKIAGNLKAGDTVLHSTGPNQAAQLQLKEEKRQATLVTTTQNGDTLLIGMDGKNEKIQIVTPWGLIEASKENGLNLISDDATAGIQIKGSVVTIFGKVVLGGRNAGPPILAGAPPGVPVAGVFAGLP